jgi:GT2 family glycosyltransferase
MISTPRVSVVVATYNRGPSLVELLDDLAAQDMSDFEVVVVDDGSKTPAAPLLEGRKDPYLLTAIRQPNGGAAAARHHGIQLARGEIIVILDDDMRVDPGFLGAHVREHDRGNTLVLGNIDFGAAKDGGRTRVHDKFLVRQHQRIISAYREDRRVPHGPDVCTGNVSFRRAEYEGIGGFDLSLPRCEDRDLGVRLEQAGAKLTFAPDARSSHRSDVEADLFFERVFLYGRHDPRIARKHADLESVDPWAFVFRVHPVTRPFLALTVAAPEVGRAIARAAYRVAELSDWLGAERAAIAGVTFAYGLHYFAGVRADAGSLRASASGLRAYLQKRRAAHARVADS